MSTDLPKPASHPGLTAALARVLLVLAILASPSVLIAGAVQIAAVVDAVECPPPVPCLTGGR